jgi:hypothetical protein
MCMCMQQHWCCHYGEQLYTWRGTIVGAACNLVFLPAHCCGHVRLCVARRATDRLAVSKLVSQLTRASVKSPMGQCLLVRYVSQVSAGEVCVRWL